MFSSFFAAHFFMEFASSQNKYFAVEMLEELLVNCSAKELKGVDDIEIYENNKYWMRYLRDQTFRKLVAHTENIV